MNKSTGYLRSPRRSPIRRALFQVHLWSGLLTGLYIVAISLSGSVLVYRTELRARFNPEPRIVEVSGTRMSEEEMVRAGELSYPEHEIFIYTNPEDPTHAVSLGVNRADSARQMFIDPYNGQPLGNAVPWGWRATSWLLDFHGNLVAGDLGKRINGVGSIVLALLTISGVFVWWPGLGKVARALVVDWRAGRKRLVWSLHGALGIWTVAFVFMWAATGIYLTFPEPFAATVDFLDPMDPKSFEPRTGDNVLYWIAYVHFGRFGGEPTKLLWAVIGLAPPILFATGSLMWWNRKLRPKLQSRSKTA